MGMRRRSAKKEKRVLLLHCINWFFLPDYKDITRRLAGESGAILRAPLVGACAGEGSNTWHDEEFWFARCVRDD